MPALPAADQRIVRKALTTLPAWVDQAKQKEMGEMMGKLKEVGDQALVLVADEGEGLRVFLLMRRSSEMAY